MDYGVGFAYVGQEFVSEAFAFRGTFDESGYIDDFDCCGDYGARVAHLDEFVKAFVGYGNDSYGGFDGAEGEVGRLSLSV